MRVVEKNKKLKDLLIIIIFCTFIFGGGILFIVSPKINISSKEKRVLEELPKLSMSALIDGSYEKKIETYLSDHFPLREKFIGINSYSNLIFGKNEINGIYKCKDGYLINKPIIYNEKNMEKNLKSIKSFVNENSLKLSLMIVPSTGYIMNDKLPRNHDDYLDGKILDNIKEGVDEDIQWIDLEDTFIKEKENNRIFYKTDHHWTTFGAYLAYENFGTKEGLSLKDKSQYDKENYEDFYGTTYSKSGLWNNPSDNIEIWSNKGDIEIEIKDDNKEGTIKSNSLFFKDHLIEDDKYKSFLNGDHSFVKITNKDAPKGNLLIIKDSFGDSLAPFLSENYNEIYIIDLRYYKKNKVSDLIKDKGIDNVLMLYSIDNIVNDTNIIWLK